MICTEQERDALMAAVGKYGDIREGIGLAIGTDAKSAAVALEEPAIERIRAMLAPPDALTEDDLRTVQVGIQHAAAWVNLDDITAGQARVFVDDMGKCGFAIVRGVDTR